MPLKDDAKVVMIMKSEDEVQMFTNMVRSVGFNDITSYTNADLALEDILRKQYDLFLTRSEMPEMPGLVMVQKMRESGNYGLETHLFIADGIDQKEINTLAELDMPYVLVKPFNIDRVSQKLKFIRKKENELSPEEQKYRDAKSAIYSGIYDMAEDLGQQLLVETKRAEKAVVLAGHVAYLKEDLDTAREYFEEAVNLNSSSVPANHFLAQIFMTQKEFDRAAMILNGLMVNNPYNVKLIENAGLSSYESGDIETSEKAVAQLNNIDKENKAADKIGASIAIDQGDFSKARSLISGSLTGKELVAFLNNTGVKLARKKDFEGAIDMYEQCLDMLESNEYAYAIYYNLGIAYKKTGKVTEARVHLIKAIELNPNYEKAISALKGLNSARTKKGAA